MSITQSARQSRFFVRSLNQTDLIRFSQKLGMFISAKFWLNWITSQTALDMAGLLPLIGHNLPIALPTPTPNSFHLIFTKPAAEN